VDDYRSAQVGIQRPRRHGAAGFAHPDEPTQEITMRDTRLPHALTAALLTGAALTLTTIVATPAQAATTVKVSKFPVSGGNVMSVVGTTNREVITFNGSGGTIDVFTGSAASIPQGGCTLITPSQVRCTGITSLEVLSSDGDDEIRNNTTVRMGSNGGLGNDLLIGGSSNDTLNGGPGIDTANGRGGVDTCGGVENRTSCEVVTS
jgi:RTX calcium-binding nonapeptide repeat (4 copies)